MLPVTVIATLSPTYRDLVVDAVVRTGPAVAAVVYERGDGAAHRRTVDVTGVLEAEPLAGDHHCLACAVRDDLTATLDRLVALGRWDTLIVGLPAGLEPTVAVELVEHGPGSADLRTDTVTTVVDAVLLRAHLCGDDLLVEWGLQAAPEDRRSVAEVLSAQVEHATVLALAGGHRLAPTARDDVRSALAQLAPHAQLVDLGADGALDAAAVATTGRYDHARTCAHTAPGVAPPAPHPPGRGRVRTVVWEARRPFHPERLQRVLAAVAEQAARSRGSIWLANRPAQRVAWASAGRSISVGDLGSWPGEPASRLTITGFALDPRVVRGLLDGALVAEDETAPLVLADDPFAGALGPVP